MTTQSKNINLDDMIDPKVNNTNRLFVLSFKNDEITLQEIILLSITCH